VGVGVDVDVLIYKRVVVAVMGVEELRTGRCVYAPALI
jgi:hypothetical protein